MKAIKFKEFLCVLVVVLFVLFLSSENKVSNKTAQEMFDALKNTSDFSELQECDEQKFKEKCGFEKSDFESAVYYASDSVMQVKELLIIKLGDFENKEELISNLKTKNEEKSNLFEGYAPEQSALLKSFVLEEKDGFVVFSVCDSPAELRSAFKSSL